MKVDEAKVSNNSAGNRGAGERVRYPCGRGFLPFLKGRLKSIPLALTILLAACLLAPCFSEAAPDNGPRANASAPAIQNGGRDRADHGPRSTPGSPSQSGSQEVEENQVDAQATVILEWLSYDKDGNPCDAFEDMEKSVVYMKGTGFTIADQYKVAYYDGKGRLIQVSHVWAESGVIKSYCKLTDYPRAKPGDWEAVVFRANAFNGTSKAAAPQTLAEANKTKGRIISHTFKVGLGAIPELSSVLGAFGICGFCGLTYLLMRRKRCALGTA